MANLSFSRAYATYKFLNKNRGNEGNFWAFSNLVDGKLSVKDILFRLMKPDDDDVFIYKSYEDFIDVTFRANGNTALSVLWEYNNTQRLLSVYPVFKNIMGSIPFYIPYTSQFDWAIVRVDIMKSLEESIPVRTDILDKFLSSLSFFYMVDDIDKASKMSSVIFASQMQFKETYHFLNLLDKHTVYFEMTFNTQFEKMTNFEFPKNMKEFKRVGLNFVQKIKTDFYKRLLERLTNLNIKLCSLDLSSLEFTKDHHNFITDSDKLLENMSKQFEHIEGLTKKIDDLRTTLMVCKLSI